jgi:hypothetical protein
MSEWNKLAGDLKGLAAAYGADFPLPDKAPVRRIGDQELAQAAQKLAGVADRTRKTLESELKKDKTVDEPTRKSLLTQVEDWKKASETLADRVKDNQPSSAEADRVLKGAADLKTALASRQVPGSTAMLGGAAATLQTVAQAYGQTPQS